MTTKTPLYLITGFLGSGKTTLMKHIIASKADKMKLAIIQNDYAAAHIDAHELRASQKSFEIVEINNGSIFCVCQLDSFVQALADVAASLKPDAILIEASGLADPISICQIIENPKISSLVYLQHIWCVIDAVHFEKLAAFHLRSRHQVRVADTLVVNKTDLNPNPGPLNDRLKQLNPFADITQAQHCVIELIRAFEPNPQPVAYRTLPGGLEDHNPGRPPIKTGVIKTTAVISPENLRRFLSENASGAIRIKGFINLTDGRVVAYHKIYEQEALVEAENLLLPTEIVFLGHEESPGELLRKFKAYCEQ